MAAIRMRCRGGFGRNMVVVAVGFPFFRVAVLSALLGLAAAPIGHADGDRGFHEGACRPSLAGDLADSCGL